MKITKLKIRNLFGITEFESDGQSMELDGKNGVGKSAVIDAIKYALTNKSDREYLIKQGETEGEVLIETDSGLRVNRKARTNKADYKSIRQSGEHAEKNESFLREIFTELQLNPVEFAQMPANEQNRIILDLIDFKWDLNWIKEQFGEIPPGVNYEQNILRVLHEIQDNKGFYFVKREGLNRDARNNTAFIQKIGSELPENYNAAKWDAIDLGDIYERIERIRNNNDRIKESRAVVDGQTAKRESLKNWLDAEKQRLEKEENIERHDLEIHIKELQNELAMALDKLKGLAESYQPVNDNAQAQYDKEIARLDGEVKQHENIAKMELQSFDDLQEEATQAEAMKKHINEFNRMIDLKDEVVKLEEESNRLTEKIEKARTLPGEILANSNIPIIGLTIKDGLPLINNLPISNLSEGEKLDLCISIATAKEGSLKMLLIDGIERLATERREDVYKRLKAKGVQFIATRTTDDEELTVIEL